MEFAGEGRRCCQWRSDGRDLQSPAMEAAAQRNRWGKREVGRWWRWGWRRFEDGGRSGVSLAVQRSWLVLDLLCPKEEEERGRALAREGEGDGGLEKIRTCPMH